MPTSFVPCFSSWLPIQVAETPRAAEVAESGKVNIYLPTVLSMTANLRYLPKVYTNTWLLIKAIISAKIESLFSYHIAVKEHKPFEVSVINISKPTFVFLW